MEVLKFILRSALALLMLFYANTLTGQHYPSYGDERPVNINGLSFDAMEPFISADGQYLFFNNINDGINTKLFYATRVDDSTFNFVGELSGTNQPASPQLNAVADMDSLNNFYWTSARDYPQEFDNVFYGTFANGVVSNIGRLRGDFYVYAPGWILMDHGISQDGQHLYFNNAFFDNCLGPCIARIGIAKKLNDSTFSTLPNSAALLSEVNDSAYINYAPWIDRDELEIYFTRLPDDRSHSEICVSIRSSATDSFSVPKLLFSDPLAQLSEAPSLTKDKAIMYYHKRIGGVFRIRMRRRLSATGIHNFQIEKPIIRISPNPMYEIARIEYVSDAGSPVELTIWDALGNLVRNYSGIYSEAMEIERGELRPGIYFVLLVQDGQLIATTKLMLR